MSKSTGPGDPLLDNPSAFIFTDGSALPNGSAGWGVHITFPDREDTRAIWGPVSTSPSGRDWIGARRLPTMEFIFYNDFLMSTIAAFGASVPQRRPPSIGPPSIGRPIQTFHDET